CIRSGTPPGDPRELHFPDRRRGLLALVHGRRRGPSDCDRPGRLDPHSAWAWQRLPPRSSQGRALSQRARGASAVIEAVLRAMTPADIPDGLRLSQLAGWNQTFADWKRFLELAPEGAFVACVDARVCGTVTTVRYGNRVGWVGMVLTDPAV